MYKYPHFVDVPFIRGRA